MADLSFRSIELAATPGHLGTSRNDVPHEYDEFLVNPMSLTPRIADPLFPLKAGGKFHAKLFELEDGATAAAANAPRYFAVGFRHGITDISAVNIFCHPSPGNAHMDDGDYVGLSGPWNNIYRYTQYFSVQLAAGPSNMVFIMPLFSNATYTNLGVFKTRWQEIVNSLLVEVQKIAWPDKAGEAMARNRAALKHVILSDFSRGRALMSVMRDNAVGMEGLLREIWDFDGKGGMPPGAPKGGQALIFNQESGGGHNVFCVPLPRWKLFPGYHIYQHSKEGVHGEIPQRLAHAAAAVSAYGH